jgi:hypothetical protein
MDEDALRSFASFDADRHRALLRQAFLHTGDRAAAHELVRRALSRTCRHWPPPGDALVLARRAVVGGLRGYPRPVQPAGDGLGASLLELPPRMRAAVVLRFHEDLSVPDTARVLGSSESTAESLATTGLNRLADTVGTSSLEPPDAPLRRRLRVLADGAGEPAADANPLVDDLAREDRARRRRRGAGVLAAAALVAAAVAVTNVVAAPPAREPAAAPSSRSEEPRVTRLEVATSRQDVFDRPTRGSLGGDEAFLAALRTVPWWPQGIAPDENSVDSPVDGRHVVYASDVPTGRWALVVGRPVVAPAQPWGGGSTYGIMAAAWLTGPPGATADQMAPATEPTVLEAGWPAALLDPTAGVLVVVADPGDVVEVSERPEIDADGSTSREFRAVETTDGIAVARLTGSRLPHGGAVAFRARSGGPDGEPLASWSMTVLDGPDDVVPVAYRRGVPTGAALDAADYAAARAQAAVGLPPEDVEVTAQWTGNVPDEGPAQAAVVTMTVPSGAVVVVGQWVLRDRDGNSQSADCGFAVLPAGPPADQRVLPMLCDIPVDPAGSALRPTLVVVGPPDIESVRTYGAEGSFLSEHLPVDGVTVTPMPFGLETVEAVTAGGVSLGRVPILGHTDQFDD